MAVGAAGVTFKGRDGQAHRPIGGAGAAAFTRIIGARWSRDEPNAAKSRAASRGQAQPPGADGYVAIVRDSVALHRSLFVYGFTLLVLGTRGRAARRARAPPLRAVVRAALRLVIGQACEAFRV